MVTLNAEYSMLKNARADLVAYLVVEDKVHFQEQVGELRQSIPSSSSVLKAARFAGKVNETLMIYPEGLRAKKVLLIGLGSAQSLSPERLRRAAATAAKAAQGEKARKLAIMEPNPEIGRAHV